MQLSLWCQGQQQGVGRASQPVLPKGTCVLYGTTSRAAQSELPHGNLHSAAR